MSSPVSVAAATAGGGASDAAVVSIVVSIHGFPQVGHSVSSAGRGVPQCTQIGSCEEVVFIGREHTNEALICVL